MICNAKKLLPKHQQKIAKEVSRLSQEEGSSLLPKTAEEILAMIQNEIIFAKIDERGTPLFVVAFEPTGNQDFIEVGATCNLAQGIIKGKDVFPLIIDAYRHLNGNGKHILYLTTTDIRMEKIAMRSGFKEINSIEDLFPPDVAEFCCFPCKPEKTGVKCYGEQIDCCPRFDGTFIPAVGKEHTRIPCKILSQKI